MATVLVIDDSEVTRDIVEKYLLVYEHRVVRAMAGDEGIRLARITRPDIILLDRHLPDMDGLDVMQQFTNDLRTRNIPIIFITSDSSDESLEEVLEAGAWDYLTKPFSQMQLKARVNVALRTADYIAKLRESARVDPLTGLKNRMTFDESLEQSIKRLKDRGEAFALMMLDLDHFKQLNDDNGHNVGDEALRLTAGVIQESIPKRFEAFRYGGEEFAIVMHGTEADEAKWVAEHLLRKIRAQSITDADAGEIKVTASAGLSIASSDLEIRSAVDMVIHADRALYEAKDAGRDCVKVASGD